MLAQLTIRNFAIVEALDLDLKAGMTVVSGETGAGKSIMLDALGLAMGDRAEAGCVRLGAERAEIIASFDISQLHDARNWLTSQDLDSDNECIIRRVITKEGRSRSYINGQTCPLNALKQLGEHLIAIHGQHEHQRLLKKDHHRDLLDQFSQGTPHTKKVAQLFNTWHSQRKQLHALMNQSAEHHAKVQLLSYQVEELDQINLQTDELADLEQEQKQLSQAGDILHSGHHSLNLISDGDGDNCESILSQALQALVNLQLDTNPVNQTIELLQSAQIQVQEAGNELRHYLDRVEMNPTRLQQIEDRLSVLFDIARKHRIAPEDIPALHLTLQAELDELNHSDEALEALTQQVEQHEKDYFAAATKLTANRQKAAKKLNKLVDEQLHLLGMSSAAFTATLNPLEKPHATGAEEVEFLITTNKGLPPRPLAKIASGGELSRISLAIQVITAQCSTTPTLIFDEVDVGIGGAIAEVVGRLLRQLGKQAQVLCVTHQPQVASQGHQHLFVSKRSDRASTHTRINELAKDERIQEVARMLGGIDVTQRSIEHAREMLGTVH